jgi:hypothetical protein
MVMLVGGCTNVTRFDYSSAQGGFVSAGFGGSGKVLAVLPYNDVRALHNSMPESGSFYWGLLPLMPFGPVFKPEPEKSSDFISLGYYHFDPDNDLQRAAAMSFTQSGLFGKVVAVDSMAAAKEINADYIWCGKVENTGYQGYMLTYCITYFLAPVLWVAGAPEGISINELAISGELVDAYGNVIFANRVADSEWLMHWIYARTGADCRNYPVLMKQLMNKTVADMAQRNL